jgi:hypothetical protein
MDARVESVREGEVRIPGAGDYSTSIIFAAMAVEAELARMFFKWRKIDFFHEMAVGLEPPRTLSLTRSSMRSTEV